MYELCTRKRYFKLLILLSMLFLHIFVHTKEYDCSTQVGVVTFLRSYVGQAFLYLHQGHLNTWSPGWYSEDDPTYFKLPKYKNHSKYFQIVPGSKWQFRSYASDQFESKLTRFQTWLNLKISDIKITSKLFQVWLGFQSGLLACDVPSILSKN